MKTCSVVDSSGSHCPEKPWVKISGQETYLCRQCLQNALYGTYGFKNVPIAYEILPKDIPAQEIKLPEITFSAGVSNQDNQ